VHSIATIAVSPFTLTVFIVAPIFSGIRIARAPKPTPLTLRSYSRDMRE
jgi:hypothetical protein